MTSSRTSKRKALKPSNSMVSRHVAVDPLHIENMFITSQGSTLYFKRLKYKGCPKLTKGSFGKIPSRFIQGIELIDAGRDEFIRECYQLLSDCNQSSAYTYFNNLINYLVWIDDTGHAIPEEGYLAWPLINLYMDWCTQQNYLGQMTLSSYSLRRSCISWFLRQTNRGHYAKKLPSVCGVKDARVQNESLDLESELKPTVTALFRAYSILLKQFYEGPPLKRHPLYNESLIEQEATRQGIKGRPLGFRKTAFVTAITRAHPHKHIIDMAMMLTYMFTGMNKKSMSDIRISDVTFREVQGGKYIFDSVKGRAMHQEQDNTMGFSKHARRFIESWLEVSRKIANGNEDAYLFPFITLNGPAISYSQTSRQPQQSINKLLVHLGLTTITPSKFRKTKSDTLYRVTESVYLVAMSNNNSMEVTARTYIHGTEKEHENNLSAALNAKFEIAKGKEVKAAVVEAKYKHGDILDDYEYQRLRKGQDRTHEARTPTGARCKDNRQGAASIIEKSLKQAGINTIESEMVCTDFLYCFNCQQHVFVTDVDDIWLMLSFKETLQQLQQVPAINSMPERKYIDLFNTVETVLNGLRIKNESNYSQALEKLKDATHPLYATVYSLNDLLETFS